MTPPRLLPLLSLSRPAVIAHRGGSRLQPENTLAAFARAVSLGVDAIECDVRLSRDGDVMVIHDETVDRTTDATGPVAALLADELLRLDAGFHFDAEHGHPCRRQGIGVPRLRDALARWPDMPFVVEIKGDDAATGRALVDVIRSADARDRVIVGGFSRAVLDDVRRAAPDLATSASLPDVRSALRRAWLRLRPVRSGFDVFQVPCRFRGRRVLSRAFVRAARAAGVPVHVWVVDDPGEMGTLLSWGVTGLISDRPDVALQVVRAISTDGRP